MATNVPRAQRLRTAFRKQKVIAPLHTAGPFAVSCDGSKIVTCVGEEAMLTEVETSTEICRFKGDGTSITAIAITPSVSHVVVFYTSLFLRTYEIPLQPESISGPLPWSRQTSRAHDAPIHVACIDDSSSLIASGSADGVVKVWDLRRGYVTHAFRGHGGVVSALAFNSQKSGTSTASIQLITGSVDTRIRIFDLAAAASRAAGAKPQVVLEGHVSVPRGLSVSSNGKWLVSGGRDAVVLIWDLHRAISSSAASSKAKTSASQHALVKTIPVLERVEAVGVLSEATAAGETAADGAETLRFFTAGEKGVVRIWDAWSQQVLSTLHGQGAISSLGEDEREQREIVTAFYIPSVSVIVTLHANQNILFHSIGDSSLLRQFIGFNDEIIDATFLSPHSDTPDSSIALATNSSLIRVYTVSNLDTRLISGHSGIVLCLDRDVGGRVLASGSKDKTARLWTTGEDGSWGCIAVCEGHAESIGAIALSRTTPKDDESLRFMFTGSQDRTIKMWDLSSVPSTYPSHAQGEAVRPKSLTTHKAHDKDINSLDISPNDRFLATGSQDKTVKIFEIIYQATGSGARGEIKQVGTLKGHKRGVWNVKFSRFDRVIATASGDKSVKLWSLDDYSCLKTFEGHTNSVLRVEFLNRGLQLISSASDGLVKLWNIRDEECINSLDNHEDKVWALAVSSDEKTIASGAADSIVTFWKDCTEQEEQEKETHRADLVLKEQDFMNYVSVQDYRNAILLALSMDQPGRLFKLFQGVRAGRTSSEGLPSITGQAAVDQVIKTLPSLELARLLRHIRNWNASSKTHPVAQTILHAILKLRPAEDIISAFNGDTAVLLDVSNSADMDESNQGAPKDKDLRALRDLVDGLIPYTERHLARADRMVQDSFIVDYILSEMDSGVLVGDGEAMEVD